MVKARKRCCSQGGEWSDDDGSWCSKEIVFKIWDLKGRSEIDSKKSLIGTCAVPIELCPLDGHWREITLEVEPLGRSTLYDR